MGTQRSSISCPAWGSTRLVTLLEECGFQSPSLLPDEVPSSSDALWYLGML